MNYFDFFNDHWVLTLELIIILILLVINELYISRNSKSFLSIDEVVDMINHKDAKIIDIRESSKFMSGHIKNSFNVDINGISDIGYLMRKLSKNNVVICSNLDYNTKTALNILKKAGLKKVFILKGGIQSWENAGFPLTKKNNKLQSSNKK